MSAAGAFGRALREAKLCKNKQPENAQCFRSRVSESRTLRKRAAGERSMFWGRVSENRTLRKRAAESKQCFKGCVMKNMAWQIRAGIDRAGKGKINMSEKEYMLRAIELAKQAEGFTNPNPMVGAVIVKDGRIIGEGYHKMYGGLHAERNAIASLTESAEGAAIYVTLEPCCHYGKTPPCTEAIIENKIAKVIIGSRDPNPLVAGKGAARLQQAGIEVVRDFMRKECDALNPVFFHYITTKTPYVVLKYAMTCDGKIATRTGASKWITGEAARQEVQHMRHRYMGIMAGIGTVLADDPMLNVRVRNLKSPVRIICDTKLRIPLASNIVRTAQEYRTIVACGLSAFSYGIPDFDDGTAVCVSRNETGDLYKSDRNAENHEEQELRKKIKELTEKGIEVVNFPDGNGKVDVIRLMKYLGSSGIDSVLVEGGGTLNDALLRAGIVNRLEVFVAPKIFGGAQAKSPVEGEGIAEVSEAVKFRPENVRLIGDDILLSYISDSEYEPE